ncbi:MAG TPA: ATP-binding protein [Anaerolineae bacterium]|nr:ATP-binding protein [Anaerolineae bacterium]
MTHSTETRADAARHGRLHTLQAKLLIPLVGLMIASLVLSTLAFLVGITRTQDQLLTQQIQQDVQRVQQALSARANQVSTAAGMLAHDPVVNVAIRSTADDALATLNDRAVVIRDRLDIDLIQVYNQAGNARINLAAAGLYQTSSLLGTIGQETTVVLPVGDKLLLLSQAACPDAVCTIITGIDLASELKRIVAQEHLPADLGLKLGEQRVTTRPDLLLDVPNGRTGSEFMWHTTFTLAAAPLQLSVVRQAEDVTQVTNAGLAVMIGGAFITLLLLSAIGVWLTRAITRPIQQLSVAASTLAKGDLSRSAELLPEAHRFTIGDRDEIGMLSQAFRHMTDELNMAYIRLEDKVRERTQQLTAAAEVARTASASLDLEVTLRQAVASICERFGFYHAAIFIFDVTSNQLVLRESRGNAGEALKESQYSLAPGSRSLVGTAAVTRQPQIAPDVTADLRHLNNPLLIGTRSEAAFPLLYGEILVGVLDVQSTELNAFPPEMVNVLSTLADQLGVAIHNAQIYAEQHTAAERLAELDHLKMEFLANMSREFRTPLNNVQATTHLLLKGADGKLNDLQRNDVTCIAQNSQQLLSLINNLLDHSQLEAGQLTLARQPGVNLKPLIQIAMSQAIALVGHKPIGLVSEVDPGLPSIEADPDRVQQILSNLISNAAKFTESGQIGVLAHAVYGLGPRSDKIEQFIEVRISDSGCGIPAAEVNKTFEPFTHSQTVAGGAGLGLSITRRLVELHGGRIWVESAAGHGSTFIFILPVHAPSSVLPVENPFTLKESDALV